MEIHESWSEMIACRVYEAVLQDGRRTGRYDTREAAEAAGRRAMAKTINPAPVAHPTKNRDTCEWQARDAIYMLLELEELIDDIDESDLPDGLEVAVMELADWRLRHVRELLTSFRAQLRNIKLEREAKHGGGTSQNGRV
jgi:hypothetical protein